MEATQIGLTILIAIVVFGTAINYFDHRMKPREVREQARRKAQPKRTQ
ncbi:hypothetical protein N7414_10540 [Pseudomonas sp. GD04087]|nr:MULTISPECIES: hypothetical protein [Pseudomonas]MCP1647858.1 hypothetical protein [Pseudomonas nitroreducens]MCP1686434.1 hypothetical protein [Pseudomonas nitroreducens]MDH0289549.1 hypothetical protein [Pseudomonas sp. GD04087]MDH1050955.1 hypothetical protein [Pseudomonas sp. GD03903]MDH2000386.1 hypothetical protein [Pseudomonas sp. GD03691]